MDNLLVVRRQLDNLHLIQPIENMTDTVWLHPLIREFMREKQAERTEPLMQAESLQNGLVRVMAAFGQRIPQVLSQDMVVSLAPVIPHLEEVATQMSEWLDDHHLIWLFSGPGKFYQAQGLYALAEPWYKSCLNTAQERFGERHPAVATSLSNLARLYLFQGHYKEAEPLYTQALEMTKLGRGEEHADVATSLHNLATLYLYQGRYEEAESLYTQALEMSKRLLGDNHPDVATGLSNLVTVYDNQGRYEEAEPLFIKSLDISKQLLGDDHPNVASVLNNLAMLYYNQGRYEEAEPLFIKSLDISSIR